MKSVVLKTEGHKSILLDSDGTFRQANNRGYITGQVLRQAATPLLRRAAAIAAAAVLLLGGGSALAYYTPASYASVDINPSIEFQLNLIGHVIGARGVNDDGRALLSHIKTGANLGQNIQAVVREAVAEGYLQPDDDNTVVVTIANDNQNQARQATEQAQEQAQEALQQTGAAADVEVDRVGYDRVQEARKLGTTPGKLNLVQKYIESAGPSTQVDVQQWLNKPVKEIMKAIKANRKAAKADQSTVSAATPAASPHAADGSTASPAPTATLQDDDKNGKDDDQGGKKVKDKDDKYNNGQGNEDRDENSKDNNGKGHLDSHKSERSSKYNARPSRTHKPTHNGDNKYSSNN